MFSSSVANRNLVASSDDEASSSESSVASRKRLRKMNDSDEEESTSRSSKGARKGKEPEDDDEIVIDEEEEEEEETSRKSKKRKKPKTKKVKKVAKRKSKSKSSSSSSSGSNEEDSSSEESEDELSSFTSFERRFVTSTVEGYGTKERWLTIEKDESERQRVVLTVHIPKLETLSWFNYLIDFMCKYNPTPSFKTYAELGQALIDSDNGAPLNIFIRECVKYFVLFRPTPKVERPTPDRSKKAPSNEREQEEPEPVPTNDASSSESMTMRRIPDAELGDDQEPVSEEARRAIEGARRMAEENSAADSPSRSIVYRSPRPDEDPTEYIMNLGNAIKQTAAQVIQKRVEQIKKNTNDPKAIEEVERVTQKALSKFQESPIRPQESLTPSRHSSSVGASPSPSRCSVSPYRDEDEGRIVASQSPAPSPKNTRRPSAARGMTQNSATRLKENFESYLRKLNLEHEDPDTIRGIKECFEQAILRAGGFP